MIVLLYFRSCLATGCRCWLL